MFLVPGRMFRSYSVCATRLLSRCLLGGSARRRFCTAAGVAPVIQVPTVDVSAFTGTGPSSKELKAATAHELLAACEDIGFFGVIGHGVADGTLADLRSAASTFFASTPQAAAARASVKLPEASYPYGYAPLASEALDTTGAHADLKETYSVGPLVAPTPIPDDDVARFAFADNRWPDEDQYTELALFRQRIESYYKAADRLVHQLLHAAEMALDLPPQFFKHRCNAHMSALRLNHYPALGPGTVQARPGQLRAGPHTDYGTITILLPDTNSDTADSTAGLQVFVNGAWCNVVATPGALIVNVGDLMQRWTSDRWVSTCHRVAAAPAGTHAPQRLSVAYFHQPDWDAVVEALPVHPGDSNKAHPRYAPTTAGEHIKAKFEAAGAAVE